MNNSVLCKEVSKTYLQGEITVQALVEINLAIDSGSFVALCGPSGSGKTTLLNLIGGLDRATSGEVIVSGKNLAELSKSELAELRLHSLGFVFQSYNLIPVFSTKENVEFVMQLQGVSGEERAKRARDILHEVGLSGLENRRPGQLSGGQQQRVAVARAIVGGPSIVLADEPTANLDSETAKSLLLLMERINRERGVTFIFSTHDPQVMGFARRLIRLHDGRVVGDETKAS